jgi:hypothetical protein
MIKVTVQREDRLAAITKLSSAIEKVATALSTCPEVVISNCHFECSENSDGVCIDTADEVTRTEIKEFN